MFATHRTAAGTYTVTDHPTWTIEKVAPQCWLINRNGNLVHHRETLKEARRLVTEGFKRGYYKD